ncbi:hypothetical protein [Serratia fonticola]|uniref:hypothetical protein n=1 Tax=Serratia fonticola TaxID=47917 RepID=UPI0013783871|nr:hypothetical protein [Serratia fonticola]NCG53728.1 hypothetical protein [Serratia fonticola]
MSDNKINTKVLIPVCAVRIKSVSAIDGGFAIITPDIDQEIKDQITVTGDFIEKYNPQPGGYYVMCEGGVGLYSDA